MNQNPNQTLQDRIKVAIQDICNSIDIPDRRLVYSFITEIDKYNLEKIGTVDSTNAISTYINSLTNPEYVTNFLTKLRYKLITNGVHDELKKTIESIYNVEANRSLQKDTLLYVFLRLESLTFFQSIKIDNKETEDEQ